MLTEAEVLSAIPSHGFIRDYVVHSIKQTTSPLCYHLLVGLGILAATCPMEYGMPYAGDILRANVFGLLVGRSGEDQKSTAVNIGRGILYSAGPPLIGDYPGSPEGLLDSLSRTPSQMIPIPEFGRFLASAQRGYFEPTKALITDLWDCQPQTRAKANGKMVRVDNPRLSILTACSLPYLEKYTMAEDWTGGFMGRWLVMYGHRERTDPNPQGDLSALDMLVANLRERSGIAEAGTCLGLAPDALALWNEWFYDISNRQLPDVITGVRARAPTLARKVALLYAWDWLRPLQGDWYMQREEVEYAIRTIELHIKSLIGISHAIADSPDARQRRETIEVLKQFEGRWFDLGDAVGALKWKKRTVQEMLDSLCEERRLERELHTGAAMFRLRSTDEVAALEKARRNPIPWE